MARRGTSEEVRIVRVLLDTNILLDVLLARQPWMANAQVVWRAHDDGRITAYASASSITDIHYIVRRHAGPSVARASVRICLRTFEICTVDRAILQSADHLPGADFEDNVQIACAEAAELDAIVTRDPRGFAGSPIPILSPDDLLRRLGIHARDAGDAGPGERATDEPTHGPR